MRPVRSQRQTKGTRHVLEPLDKRHSTLVAQCARQHVAALRQHNQADTGLDGSAPQPKPVATVGIVGAGLMGTCIAAAFVRAGRQVWIADHDPAALANAPERIVAELSDQYSTEEARRKVCALVRVADEAQLGACDLVIESIVESFSAKQSLLRRMEAQMRPGALLASNTSTIPISRLGDALACPDRFLGLHFCHPVRARPLVEIVRGPQTGDQTVATAMGCIKAIGKMPIVVGDGPGFLVNRLLLPYLGEALELLLEGVAIEAIEQTAREFGMAKGPFRLLDEIGLDTTLRAAWMLAEAYPERVVASPVLVSLVKAGRLGCKSGHGFFCYTDHSRPIGQSCAYQTQTPPVDPLARQIISQWAEPARACSSHAIAARLLLPMLLEATRVLEERKVRHARDIDLAAIFGLGFPGWRGGLLWWADSLGAARIIEALRPLARLGPRAEPTAMLREMARRGGQFHG